METLGLVLLGLVIVGVIAGIVYTLTGRRRYPLKEIYRDIIVRQQSRKSPWVASVCYPACGEFGDTMIGELRSESLDTMRHEIDLYYIRCADIHRKNHRYYYT